MTLIVKDHVTASFGQAMTSMFEHIHLIGFWKYFVYMLLFTA